jgi:predicted nucleic acid-binding protein
MAPQLRLREQVSAHWPLGGATLSQRARALVNKLVRRYLRWYINPIVEQQNAANAAFSVALAAMIQVDAERRAEVAALRAKTRRQGDKDKLGL